MSVQKQNVEIRYRQDHVEVFCGGRFWFSADTVWEAMQEIEDAA